MRYICKNFLISSFVFTCWFTFIFSALFPTLCQADTENASRFWFMSLTRLKHSESLRSFIDLQPRTSIDDPEQGEDGNVRQFLARGALGYQITPSSTLYQGYGLITNYGPKKSEHRSFQELLSSYTLQSFQLTHRFRFEQRFIEGRNGVSLRGRYFFRLQRAIPHLESVALAASNELFVTLNEPGDGPKAGFDQNRVFLGVNYSLSDSLSVDLGYQNQYVERRGGISNVSNHIVFLGLISKFDLS